MKTYTTLEQSRKLAEILPTESADMYYSLSDGEQKPDLGYDYNFAKVQTDSKLLTPCWSLAALLSVIPNVALDQNKDGSWDLFVKEDSIALYAKEVVKNIHDLIDGCYYLILKLHLQNLL